MGLSGNALGAVLAVSGSIVSNLGTNIQKRSHKNAEAQKLRGEPVKSYVWRPYWWLGFLGVFCGSLVDFLAFGYGDQGLITALGGSTVLITNVFLGYFWQNEPLYNTDIGGVICMIAGSVTFSFTTSAELPISMSDLEDNFQNKPFLIYISVQSFFVIILLATIANTKWYTWRASITRKILRPLIRDIKQQNITLREQNRELHLRLLRVEKNMRHLKRDLQHQKKISNSSTLTEKDTHTETSVDQDFPEVNVNEPTYRHWSDPYIYATTAGIVGAFAVLFASCTSKIIVHDLNQGVTTITFYVSSALMVFCLLWQTHLLNKGLEVGDVMIVLPTFQAFWISFGVVSGLVFYRRNSIPLTGLFFIFIGVILFLKHGEESPERPIRNQYESFEAIPPYNVEKYQGTAIRTYQTSEGISVPYVGGDRISNLEPGDRFDIIGRGDNAPLMTPQSV